MQIRPNAFTIGLIIHPSIALFCVYTEFGIDSSKLRSALIFSTKSDIRQFLYKTKPPCITQDGFAVLFLGSFFFLRRLSRTLNTRHRVNALALGRSVRRLGDKQVEQVLELESLQQLYKIEQPYIVPILEAGNSPDRDRRLLREFRCCYTVTYAILLEARRELLGYDSLLHSPVDSYGLCPSQ